MILIRDTNVSSDSKPDFAISRAPLGKSAYNTQRSVPVFLPAFIRMFDMDSQVVVFERAPEEKLIHYQDKIYNILLPWTLYIICLNNLEKFDIFFNTSQLNELNDTLMAPPLPNVSTNGHICTAKPEYMINHIFKSKAIDQLRDRITYLYHMVWDSLFNNEYCLPVENLPTFVPKGIIEELQAITDMTTQWHKWLAWWEENVDLLTVMTWDSKNKVPLSTKIEKPAQFPEDGNASVTETVLLSFLETFSGTAI